MVRQARALIELPRAKNGTVPIVGASLRVAEDGSASFNLFRGFCADSTEDLSGCMISSKGYVSGNLTQDQYEFDSALGSASFTVTRGGKTHAVTWTGKGDVGPRAFEAHCEEGLYVAVGMSRSAEVAGKIFGKKARPEASTGDLDALAYAGACA